MERYQVVSAKIAVPQIHAHYLTRPRLQKKLERYAEYKLTLVSAPAGFGKTTAVSDWIEKNAVPAIWISLEPGDNAFARFWSYLAAAVDQLEPGTADRLKPVLHSFTQDSAEAMLSLFVNELARIEGDLVLVLDDYHVIENHAIHESLSFLIDHLPPSFHLLIISRSMPPIPHSRLRAYQELLELDSNDLRFTFEEIRDLQAKVMDTPLSSEELNVLEKKTEGWVAGLHLAFLSLAGRKDTASFLQAFSGNQRHVVDYLVDEVLLCQTKPMQAFLLQTSILSRMNASLAQAVTGEASAAALLSQIEQDNLFLIPLDDIRKWYRYHHLFGQMLRNRLEKEYSDDHIRPLHRRAHRWYQETGDYGEAILHALAAKDFEVAASYMEKSFPLIIQSGEEALLQRWLEQLPLQSILDVPNLFYFEVTRLAFQGRIGEAMLYLERAESLLREGIGQISPEKAAELETKITLYRASIAYYQHDIDSFLALVGANKEGVQQFGQIVHVMNLGEAMLYRGPIGFGGRLSKMAYLTSILSGSEQTRALLHGALGGYALIFLADLHYERNLLSEANNYVDQAVRYARVTKQAGVLATGSILQAKGKQAIGQNQDALFLLRRAREDLQQMQAPRWQQLVEACLVRMQLAAGNAGEGERWIAQRHMQVTELPRVSQEYENLTLARVLMAQKKTAEAKAWLHLLLLVAEQANRVGSQIEILLLQALCFHGGGQREEAIKTLRNALDLARTEGYIRIFLDEGVPMEELLANATQADRLQDEENLVYAKKLLLLFNPREGAAASLVSFTNREKDVLKYISEGLSNQEIADRLFLTLGTTKKYVHTIFQKLEVKNRVQAAKKARQMEL